ncbi:unnamed protein product [Cladocopium goreaui]|uniref:Uncharacterized protein n=1 Tax=Cladocopium goreaui TaxID=2562237 RepID=A0A9P1GPZ4_9DINO|nr:unnamed protein product [Cladocopium goreaui]CAI4018899.1 unnamed protein product [Cladocopium goreaui]|mmetsp:Transcript_17582/g.38745  ORF Transcript_17582/g.38745 Transcript_17582/m.38745 type:complete len:89 (-) Transcript_17582:216-482(-)
MQTPAQQVSQLAQQNSISTLVARVRARSAGTPMPFTSQGPVENSESGRGYTLGREYPTMGHGDMFSGIVTPVALSLTFCIMIGKTLAK